MSQLRETARSLADIGRRRRGILLCSLPIAGVTWTSGLTLWPSLLIGATGAALLVLVVGVRQSAAIEPLAKVTQDAETSRSEFSAIRWSFDGRSKRVTEAALRRVQHLARSRLSRLGIGLDDAAAKEMLGKRAWATVTNPGGLLPKLGDIEHAVGVLERLPISSAPSTETQ